MIISPRVHWWDGAFWFRTYREGGLDGWRTIGGRQMACHTMFVALTAPHMHDEIRQLTRR